MITITEIKIETETGTIMNSDHTRASVIFERNGRQHRAHAVRYHGTYLGEPQGVQTDWAVTHIMRHQRSSRGGRMVWQRVQDSAALQVMKDEIVRAIKAQEMPQTPAGLDDDAALIAGDES